MATKTQELSSFDFRPTSKNEAETISHVEDGPQAMDSHMPVDSDGKVLGFVAGRPVLHPEDERAMKKLKRKLDMWILPLLTILMLLSSMDRSDIGNAQTAGMQKSIGATNQQWSEVVSLFYLGYCLSQFLATVQMRKYGPPLVVGFGCMFWGAMTMLLVVVKNWSGAVAVRVFIGFGEGYVHVASLYLSLWYGPEELATRGAIYFSTSTLAGAFNGLISYGIVMNIGNTPPYKAWQWIVLIEGAITVGFGLLLLLLLPEVPEKVRWGFTSEEKRLLLIRTWRANNTPHTKFKWNELMVTFKDPTFYGYLVMFGACQIGVNSLSSFLPAVIQAQGYTAVKAQLMTVPIYASAFVGTIGMGFLADRFQQRGLAVIFATLVALVGYSMLAAIPETVAPRYGALCLIAAGMFANTNLILTWLAFNTRKWSHRATAGAFVTTWGQACSLLGLQGFNTEPPYHKGNIITLSCVVVGIIGSLFNMWYYLRQNKLKDAVSDHPETEIKRQMSFEELGTAHPDFRFSV